MSKTDMAKLSTMRDIAQGSGEAPDDGTEHEAQAAQLRYALASAGGSWGREFRLLLTLAEGYGACLDAEALAFYDVRDLQALQRRVMTLDASRGELVACS